MVDAAQVYVNSEPVKHHVKSVTLYDYDPPYIRTPQPKKRRRKLKPRQSFYVQLDSAPPASDIPIVVMYPIIY